MKYIIKINITCWKKMLKLPIEEMQLQITSKVHKVHEDFTSSDIQCLIEKERNRLPPNTLEVSLSLFAKLKIYFNLAKLSNHIVYKDI